MTANSTSSTMLETDSNAATKSNTCNLFQFIGISHNDPPELDNPQVTTEDEYTMRNRAKRPRMDIETIIESEEAFDLSTDLLAIKTTLHQLVKEIKRLNLEVSELRETQRKLLPTDQIASNPFSHPPPSNTSSLPLHDNTTTNYRAAPTKLTYSSVVARNLVGRRSDTIEVINNPQPSKTTHHESQIPKATNEEIQRLTTTYKTPEHHKLIVLRFAKMAQRKKVNAREWRNLLRMKGITPFTILFPRNNTLELVLPLEQEQKTRDYFRTLEREVENPDPYYRRDGKEQSLPQETIVREVTARIQMLKFERSTVGSRYLQEVIQSGLKMIDDTIIHTLTLELDQVLKEKRLLQTREKSNLHIKPDQLISQ